METEVDPLDPNYVPNYEQPVHQGDYQQLEPFVQIKTEPCNEDGTEIFRDFYQIVEDLPPVSVPAATEERKADEVVEEPDPPSPVRKRKRRTKLQMSTISKEAEDIQNAIPFYCCAVCDAKYNRLEKLQKHVTEHKGRLTSWDLKVRNQKMRKTLKKAQKKLKKIKIEKLDDIEIKEEKIDPEYEKNDPTSNYGVSMGNNDVTMGNNDVKNGNNESNIAADINIPSEASIPTVRNENNDLCNELVNEIGNIIMGKLVSNVEDATQFSRNIGTDKVTEDSGVVNSVNDKVSDVNKVIGEKVISGKVIGEKLGAVNENGEKSGVDVSGDLNGVVKSEKSERNGQTEEEIDNLERIFKCGGCSKQFSLGYYLKLHVRSHTGEKPYICQECGQTFITASKLGRHRKRTHLCLRVICRICRRSYTRLEFLMKHFNKVHAEDKIEGEPYDYNAILPYLKDLEEELQQKKEEEEKRKLEESRRFGEEFMDVLQEFKPKDEDMIPELKTEIEVKHEPGIKAESDYKIEGDFVSVGVEEVGEKGGALESSGDLGDLGVSGDLGDDGDNGDHGGDFDDFAVSPKHESSDDEDYFPDNTWLPVNEEPAPIKPKKPSKPPKSNKTRHKEDTSLTTCKICHKNVSSSTYLRIHMRIHTKEKPYKCHLCEKTFITASKLTRHVMTHSNWDDDDVVKKEVDEKTEGNEDENNPEAKPKKVKKRRRRRKNQLPDGVLVKKEKTDGVHKQPKPRPHACEYCRKRFLYIEALQVHRRCHAGESAELHCGFCLTPCADIASLREHEARHAPPRPYLCTLCGRTYTKKETMIYHRRMHEADNKYQCDVCPKSFNAKNKLQRHLLSHRAGKSAVRYECPVCAHCFHTRYHVEMHLATHEKEGVIQEENRGQVLAMVLQNARRIPLETDTPADSKQLEWGDERSRICNICGEIFMHFYLLEQHLKSHGSSICKGREEEKKYICQVCNKGFKLSYYLKLHNFTHTKEKPFICQQCGKGFITRGKLKRHLETHAGLKKYQCHICCKFFTRPSYLRIHVRTIHGTQDYNFKMDSYYSESLDDISMTHDSV